MDWRHIKDDREKYAAYLCSREWSVKKDAVRSRSGGACENCLANKMDHVHHLTYARKYNERLEDLQAICRPCHEFTHGKDTNRSRFTSWVVYLAGKIAPMSSDFRRRHYCSDENDYRVDPREGCWPVLQHGLAVKSREFVYLMHYCGPFPFGIGGHGSGHGEGTHGCADATVGDHPHEMAEAWELVADNCFTNIRVCTHFWAWIDSADAYGTLVEAGYAYAMGKSVAIGYGPGAAAARDDMWLCSHLDGLGADKYASSQEFLESTVNLNLRCGGVRI